MRQNKKKKESLYSSLNDIRFPIQAFVEQLTEDQYESLTTGSPNNSTKIQLAKLLIDILMSMSKMCKNHESHMTEQKVRDLLGNSLTQTFATILNVEEAASSADIESLNRLIGAEVTEMVKSESDVSGHMTPPSRLNMIVEQTTKMLQSFVAKMKNGDFSQKKGQQKKLQQVKPTSAVVHQLVDEREWMEQVKPTSGVGHHLRDERELMEQVKHTSAVGHQLRDEREWMEQVKHTSAVGHQLRDERELMEDSEPELEACLSRPNTPVESVLLEELNGITSSLLQDVPPAQAEVVYLQTSEEMKAVLADLTEHKVKTTRAFKSAMAKVKTFFTKSFAKALIHCKVAELKAGLQTVPKEESKTSLQMLAENVDSLLNSLHSEGVRQESEWLFSCDDPNFTGLLFNVIHKGVTETEDNETAVETRMVLAPDHGSIEADIRDKMNKFLVLTSWWMNTQLGSCCERVMITLKHSQKRKPQSLGIYPEQPEISQDADVKPETWQDEEEKSDWLKVESQVTFTPPQSEIGEPKTHKDKDLEVETLLDEKVKEAQQKNTRIYIETLVELLVSKLVHKAKFAVEDQIRIRQTLSEATFAQLEQCASTEVDPGRLSGLRKHIYKDLCRDFGSADNILFLLATNDESVVSCTATVIRYRMTCPRKCGLICKWVKDATNMFRRFSIGTHLYL